MRANAGMSMIDAGSCEPISIDAFEAGDVEAAAFTHEAHIYVAWYYLRKRGLRGAVTGITEGLQRLTKQLGVPEKYHETITLFFMFLIAERCAQNSAGGWPAFKIRNNDLFENAKALLSRYYTQACLNSELARQQFVLPNRITLA